MSWSQRLQKAWYAPSARTALSLALLDLSWAYGGCVALRRKLYQSGVMNSTRLPVPVIVVGNCVVGGAGKTPIVMALTRLLASSGWSPGIVTRGYGRTSTGVQEVLPTSTVRQVGDEPALLKSTLNVPVFVGHERAEAALALLAAHPSTNVILCDDGLQHLALQRDIEICVFDQRGIGNGRLLPAGPLREPWPRAVDFVLHRGTMQVGFAIERRFADHLLLANGSRMAWEALAQHELIALAGIAHPEGFFTMLRERGLHLSATIAMPDHDSLERIPHDFSKGQWLICTEKDAIKLWRTPLAAHCQIVAAPLAIDLPAAFTTALLEKLSSLSTPTPK